MIKLPEKLTKDSLFKYIKKEYVKDEAEIGEDDTDWDRGYDAALDNIAQQFLTDKKLAELHKSKFAESGGDE